MLRVDVAKQLGEFSIEASFASEGRVTGLFGASGAGKTSLINMIAGLLRPDRGSIAIDSETLDDTAMRLHVPTHRRRIGYVFQDARLFPHLDVRANLDYGRRMNRLAEDPAQHRRVTDLLDIGGLLDRRPGQLSGGERQRVALGRALLSQPRLLLLDEPLGSLDEARKEEILPYLVRLRDEANIPMVYVSHDADEMRQLATQIVMLKRGRVTAFGGAEVLPGGTPQAVIRALSRTRTVSCAIARRQTAVASWRDESGFDASHRPGMTIQIPATDAHSSDSLRLNRRHARQRRRLLPRPPATAIRRH